MSLGMIYIGDKLLITTDCWFVAPDGKQYKAVFGTVKGVYDDESTLGIKTNRHSANWFVVIGGMTIAGCQIHYAIKAERCHLGDVTDQTLHEGRYIEGTRSSNIFNADAIGGVA